jgi:hypothetical protein
LDAIEPEPRSQPWIAPAVAAGALLFMLAVWHGTPTWYDNYVYLADAWKHGHNWLNFPGDFVDAVPYHGRAYVVEAPFPAILLYPAVLVFGTNANQTLLSNLLGAVAVYGAWRLCERIGLARLPTAAVTAFLFFGTSLFVCSIVGDVWYLGHVSAVCFTLLALCECFGKRRPWLVSTWALCAGFSRYTLLIALPIYLVLLLAHNRRRSTVEWFAAPAIPAFVTWMIYNFNRFGTLFDPGFSLFYRVMDSESKTSPALFSVAYLPMQLWTYFVEPPGLSARLPFVVAPRFGFALPFTSAPFVYAVFAGTSFEAIVLWCATLATALPSFFYYDNGEGQFGVRHALDFEPFLFALLVLAMKRRPSRIETIALAAFSAFGLYEGLFWIQTH